MNCPNCDVELMTSIVDKKEHFQCPLCPFNHCAGDTILGVIYVWVAVDRKTGMESIIALNDKGIPMPAVTSKLEIAQSMNASMNQLSIDMNMPVRLLQLSNRQVIEEINCGVRS